MSSQFVQSQSAGVSSQFGAHLWQDIFNCFRSVHLAIVLLSLLAIGTIIGVVMPQEGMVDVADIKSQYGANYEFFRTLGFFNVYSSFWFLTLEILFFFNLLIGSFKWLRPATLAAVQKNTLTPDLIVHKPGAHSLLALGKEKETLAEVVLSVLKRFRYGVYRDSAGNLYASKGNITRLGPCIAHFGILVCLIAAVYGSFTGFKAVRMALPGESFTLPEANTFKTNMAEPLWLGSIPEWRVHVKDFRIEYYEDHPETAKQYYSDLEIVSPEGKVLKRQTISVNHPLVFDDVSIYQSSFAPTGRFLLELNQQPMTLEINSDFNQRPISLTPLEDGSTLIMFPFFKGQDPGVTENHGVFFLRTPGESLPEGHMPENIRLAEGESGVLKGQQIHYLRPEVSTGLQIKRAPEVFLMYLSYLIIGIGAILCFFSQRQVWVSFRDTGSGKTEMMIYPKTNKARLSFQKELLEIEHAINTRIQPVKE